LNSDAKDDLFLGHVVGGIFWALQSNTTRAFNSSGTVGNAGSASSSAVVSGTTSNSNSGTPSRRVFYIRLVNFIILTLTKWYASGCGRMSMVLDACHPRSIGAFDAYNLDIAGILRNNLLLFSNFYSDDSVSKFQDFAAPQLGIRHGIHLHVNFRKAFTRY